VPRSASDPLEREEEEEMVKQLDVMNPDAETDVTHEDGIVIYRMLPHVARALSGVMAAEARKDGDSGWAEDAAKLETAGFEAEQ
jgi:hypothetical protein